MLKSTYKSAASASPLPPLPEGWTEHQAPSGHVYYYNAKSQVSTYTRPLSSPPQPQGSRGHTLDIESSRATLLSPFAPHEQNPGSNVHNGNSVHAESNNVRRIHPSRQQPRDRPKTKHAIPGCDPWVLIRTRLGRRFVHNPIANQSFWKFPPDVMKGVVEYDRQEREKRQRLAAVKSEVPAVAKSPAVDQKAEKEDDTHVNGEGPLDSDEEYEEVEVTDNEGDDEPISDFPGNTERDQPVDFDEDDIAFQLQAMGQEYGLDPGEYGDVAPAGLEEGADGLPLTTDDAKALFTDMLVDHRISPYTTWDTLIESGAIIEDDRYLVLPNMRSRKDIWSEWSRGKMQEMKEQRAREEKKDPKIPYFAFLQAYATPKLYWPEFRRKYQKEPEMRSNKLTDKDRERWYREYINRLKLPESNLKADFVQALKAVPLHQLNRATTLDSLPAILLTDMRFISLRPKIRNPLLEAHLATLDGAPLQTDLTAEQLEVQSKESAQRERRENALAERQRRVQEEKRKQQRDVRYEKGRLEEGEREVELAMRIDKQGLLGHMDLSK